MVKPPEGHPQYNFTAAGHVDTINIFPMTNYSFTATHFIVTRHEKRDSVPEIVFEIEYKDLQKMMDLIDNVDRLNKKADLILEKLNKLEEQSDE